jgi:hypothetical protein
MRRERGEPKRCHCEYVASVRQHIMRENAASFDLVARATEKASLLKSDVQSVITGGYILRRFNSKALVAHPERVVRRQQTDYLSC